MQYDAQNNGQVKVSALNGPHVQTLQEFLSSAAPTRHLVVASKG